MTEQTFMNKQSKDKIINCPRCSTFLKKMKLRKIMHPKGVVIDVCDNCHGIWIDGNEVEIMFNMNNTDTKTENNEHIKKTRTKHRK